MILSIPSPASLIRALRRHVPGSLSVCKAPKNFVPVKQRVLKDCKLWTPTHCKSHCRNLTRHLSICLAWPRHRSCREKKYSVLALNLDGGLSAPAGITVEVRRKLAGDHITLEANPAYHGPGPYLDRLLFKYIPDLTVLFTQFKTGEIDITGYPKEGANEGDLGGVISITLYR